MRSLSLTMPAALLLLLCLSCNNTAQYKRASSSQEAKSEVDKAPAYKSDFVANGVTGSSADTAVLAATSDQSDNEQLPAPKSSSGQHQTLTPNTPQQTASSNSDWDKKIVKTANLKLEVKNFRSFNIRLHSAIRQSGGYIAKEEQNQSDYQIENTVTIKVPVDRFEEAMSQLASDSDRLVEKKISTEDVTLQIVDTKSRLETKKEVRDRYLDLLKQARNMKDILAVQNEINDIQEQMEGAAGRIAYLGHAAAYSTINLNFYQVLDAGAKKDTEPSFLDRIKGALGNGWEWISALLVGLIGLWPLWITAGLVWVGVRKWRTSVKARPAVRLSGAGSTGSVEVEAPKE